MSALVLIVDDNEQNRRLARDVLQAAGLRTIEAASGGEAVALATEHGPDVILLDVRLPDLDGAAVAQTLRDDPRTSGITIVALTALASAPPGFDAYLAKPIDVRAFPDQVRKLASR